MYSDLYGDEKQLNCFSDILFTVKSGRLGNFLLHLTLIFLQAHAFYATIILMFLFIYCKQSLQKITNKYIGTVKKKNNGKN